MLVTPIIINSMTLLFKSKLSQLGCDLGNSPPSSLVGHGELEARDEEDEDEDEEEDSFDGFEAYDPKSTPFTNPEFSNSNSNSNGSGQFQILGLVGCALRKSLLVTCNVEKEEEEEEDDNSNVCSSMEISCPTNVRHVSHVTFDSFRGFLGLPDEFQPEILKRVPSASASVFGVSPQSMHCSIDERGNSVPTILLRMQKRLYAAGGLRSEGIFRITAENFQEESVRSQLNKGIVPQLIDVHCLAGLIKAWFRELPKGVLDCLTPEQVMECNTDDDCTRLVKLLPPMEAALLNWAITLMADVAQNEQYNKMNARNIAMVFAPNMTHMVDPLTALIHAVQVMNFLKTLIVKTLQLREEAAGKARFLSSSSDSDTIRSNPQKSISLGELISETEQEMNTYTIAGEKVHNKKLLRSVTLDRVDCNPEKKQRKSQRKNNEGKIYASTSHGSSPVIFMASESGDDDREVEAGILERLNFRKGMKKLKGVKKLCRNPVFQLSKSIKITTGIGTVTSR